MRLPRDCALAILWLSGAAPISAEQVGHLPGLTGPNSENLGRWDMAAAELTPADLFIQPDPATAGTLPVPHQQPFVSATYTPQTGATEILALVFSDAPAICADAVGTFVLDTGYAAFLTAPDGTALAAYGAAVAQTGEDPAGFTDDPLGQAPAAFITLPSSTRFPAAWVGFEGDFPLYA